MYTYRSCKACYKDVRATLQELQLHADAYHYGQSPDVIFPNHGLNYKPMDSLLRKRLVATGEEKMGRALLCNDPVIDQLNDSPVLFVASPQLEIIHEPDRKVIDPAETRRQMKVKYLSAAWEELVCQSWVTTKIIEEKDGEIAIMEKY